MNLNINTGEIRLTVNNDPERVIAFNPEDVDFAENFYTLISEFEEKAEAYKREAEKLETETETDENGIPMNTPSRLNLLREICGYFRGQIDSIFGAGTSKTAFGKANTLAMFAEFFEGIAPVIEKVREDKMQNYTGNRATRRSLK